MMVLPFLLVGLTLNAAYPAGFTVGGPPRPVAAGASIALGAGIVLWAWSVALIVRRVPKGELITNGPFTLMKHPLYTGVSLLVLPSVGLLLDSWLGVLLGAVMYAATRVCAPLEEEALSRKFGTEWDDYCASVRLPWL